MAATSIVVGPVELVLAESVGIGAATSAVGAGSSNAPSTQAPPSAALPPRREAATSAATGLAADATLPGR